MTAVASRTRARMASRTLQGFPALAAAAMSRNDPPWLVDLRHAAAIRFAEQGLPGAKDEEWRFTSLQQLASTAFHPLAAGAPVSFDAIEPLLLGHPDWPRLVVVDGRVDDRLSHLAGMRDGVSVTSLAAAAPSDARVQQHFAQHATIEATPLTAANAALFTDGAYVRIAAGVAASQPIHVLHVSTAAADRAITSPRMLLVAEAGATGTVIESYASLADTPGLTNTCVEVVLEENARIEHVRVQRQGTTGSHIGFTAVDQQRDSHYRSFTLSHGAALARHDLHARLDGSNVETLLYGLYLARESQLVDNHTAIRHLRPDCRSWEVYKGVLTDRAHGVFNGKVIVQPEAQKTDAKQTNRNLLLSDHARVDTKPQLEIFADDVKCTHGATVGRLDEQQRYYLRTRGIAGRSAEVLLITAFVAEVLNEITQADVRRALRGMVDVAMDAMIG